MCAVVDASVMGDVFGKGQNEASSKFLEWVFERKSRLVVGGYQYTELCRSRKVKQWLSEGFQAGNVLINQSEDVDARAEELDKTGLLKSNDSHIVALAQISHARLLYSNDKKLHADFKNHNLINNPRGKVYSTNPTTYPVGKFTRTHRDLLNTPNLCGEGCD